MLVIDKLVECLCLCLTITRYPFVRCMLVPAPQEYELRSALTHLERSPCSYFNDRVQIIAKIIVKIKIFAKIIA
jgi:hypothetical protein